MYIQRNFQILSRHFGNHKKQIVVLALLGLIAASANAIIPYLVGHFLDAILRPTLFITVLHNSVPVWQALLGAWVIIQIIANVLDWSILSNSRRIGTDLHAEYISNFTAHILRLPMEFHKSQRLGENWDKINRASNALFQIVENVMLNIAPQMLSVVIGLGVAFWIRPELAFVLIAGLILYIITLLRIVPPIVELQRKGYKAWGDAFGDAYDARTNAQTIKQSSAEAHESEKVYKKFMGAARIWYQVEKIWTNINSYQRLIVMLTQLVIFIFSVRFIQNGTMTIGNLIALNGYALLIFGPFMQLGRNWEIIQNGLVALENAEKIFESPTEIYHPRNAIRLESIRGEINLNDVSFRYKPEEPPVLEHITIHTQPGEIIALVGESGVGKSTLIELISGYYFAQEGSVSIDGYDIRTLDLEQLRNAIAVVPQEVILFNDTIKENIRYGNFTASDSDIENAARAAHAHGFIERFPKGYEQVVGERGIKLSAGQKQRVAIARAILRKPHILILDEPTSALDSQTEQYLTESLHHLMQGRTTFIIAHRLSTVRRANRIFVLERGTIIEEGSHEQLMQKQNGTYQRLYNLHIGLQ